MKAFAFLLTLETTTGSEKQIRANNLAIRGLLEQTNSLGTSLLPSSPLLVDSDQEQLVLLCPNVFPSHVSTETPFLVILIKKQIFFGKPLKNGFCGSLLY